MKPVETLPVELLWEDDGHLTEVVLTCLADAQDAIVPPQAHAHLDGCDRCLARLGESASRSALCAEALAHLEAQPAAASTAPLSVAEESRRRASLRPPRFAISAGLALAALGTIPFLFYVPGFLSDVSFFFSRGVPIVTSMLTHLFLSASGSIERVAFILPSAAALVLVMVGVLVARSLPKSLSSASEGGASA